MTFRECRDMYGISFLPDGLERYYDGSTNTSPLIDRRWLDSVFEKYSVGRSARADFMCALELAESDDGLCSFTHFIVEQTCAQRNRLDGEHINITSCAFLHDYGEYRYKAKAFCRDYKRAGRKSPLYHMRRSCAQSGYRKGF